MNHRLVSVIVPCYNQAHLLADAIDSLNYQSFENWECIIVNDGSTDNTAIIAEELAKTDPRIQVINQTNKGLSGARNSGLKAARGEFYQFLDADDMLESDKFKHQVEFLSQNKDIEIVYSDARYFTTDNPKLRDYGPYSNNNNESWISKLWEATGTLLEKSIERNLFPVNCPLVRSSVFNNVGIWNEKLQAHEDWEYWIRCATADIKMFYHNPPNSLALIRMHSSSMTNDTPRMHRTEYEMRRHVAPLIKYQALRERNFRIALDQLQRLNLTSLYKEVFILAYKNESINIWRITFIFLVKKLFNKYVPWPIQTSIAKIFK